MRSRAPMINVDDYRQLARKRLPRVVFDYLEGGADDEQGLQHNRNVLFDLRFTPRRLIDVRKRELSCTLFGQQLSAPLLIGPTGLNDLFWPKGDLALARAAALHNIPFVLSTASNASIEQVAKCSNGELWFQLYVVHRAFAEQLVRRALQSGYTTLVLTVDVAVNGNRERDLRNHFKLPIQPTVAMLLDGLRHPRWSLDRLIHGMPALANFADLEAPNTETQAALLSRRMDAGFDWNGLIWLRKLWPRRLLVKGIIHPDDAVRCIACGADGVILSNHGGRQLDSCLSPLQTLSETVARVDVPLLIDSGYRRGSDVVKALALGATAVLLGRTTLYGLAAAGEAGVSDVIRLLKSEIDQTLAQLGCPAVEKLSPEYVSLCPHSTAALKTQIDQKCGISKPGIDSAQNDKESSSEVGTARALHTAFSPSRQLEAHRETLGLSGEFAADC